MDNNQRPVGILDSGVGGLTAVVPMLRLLPEESIVYFGDSLRMPYGNREEEEIISLANRMIAFLENEGVKAILLACNTISSQIEKLNSSVPLFSIVKAGANAVKKEVNEPSVGVIATCATVRSGVYQRTLGNLCPTLRVVESSSASLPKVIDSQLENLPLLNEKIRECIEPVLQKDAGIKTLLLGCSHFPIIKGEIGALYPGLRFLDPAEEQVAQLKTYLTQQGLENKTGKRKITLYTTAETYEYAAAIKRLKLEIDTLMKVELP